MPVYIGPYIILERKMITTEHEIKVDPSNGVEVQWNFNPKDGTPSKLTKIQKFSYGFVNYDICDRGDLDEDMFSFPEYWAGNNKTHELAIINKDKYNLARYFDRYDHKIIEYESIIPNLDSFRELYSKYIEFFTEKSESVKIGFGIVTT